MIKNVTAYYQSTHLAEGKGQNKYLEKYLLRPLRGTKRRPGLGRVVNVYSKQISRKPENQII